MGDKAKLIQKRNPFAASQEQKVSERLRLIEKILDTLRPVRTDYKSFAQLAKLVSTQLEIIQKKSCNPATLSRNQEYSNLLRAFLAEKSKGLGRRMPRDPDAAAAVAKLTLENRNLQRELARLRSYIESAPQTPLLQNNASLDTSQEQIERLSDDFGMTCKALQAVIERVSFTVEADTNQVAIVDRSARSPKERIIVAAETAAPFFRWLKGVQNIGR